MNRIDQLTDRARGIAAKLSGMEPRDLPQDVAFMALGFDSLFLTQLASAYSREFGIKITFRQLIDQTPSLGALAKALDSALPVAAVPPAPTPIAKPAVPKSNNGAKQSAAASMSAGSADALSSVFTQQLELMQEQLRLLTGGGVDVGLDVVDVPGEAVPPARAELPAGFGPQLREAEQETPAAVRHHITRLTGRLLAKTSSSREATSTDRPHHADPRTAAGFDARWKEICYPLVVSRSQGAHLWDVDGNRYIDLLNGFGPTFFGHRPPFVTAALKAQLEDGMEIGPQTPKAGAAAKLLCELTGMDRVSWVNTGSEAVQAAIRIARTVTGRSKIAVFEGSYHGNFDEVLVRRGPNDRALPMAPGVPPESVSNVLVLPYGEGAALDRIREHANDLAAVLVEPVQSRRPEFQPHEFLHALRELTAAQEIALVFDEVITGFRTGPGGAQAYFGVEADLATYGKVLGGGMPIGAVAGRHGLMDTMDGGLWQYGDQSRPEAGVTFFAGTFVRHPLAIAAAHASLSYLKAAGPALQQGVTARAASLASRLNDLFTDRDVAFEMVQFSSQMFLRTRKAGEYAPLFFQHMRERGVHLLEGFPSYMTAAHDDSDVDAVVSAAADSLDEMLADGLFGASSHARGWQRTYTPTPTQQEIWIAAALDPSLELAYHESDTFVFEGPVDHERLKFCVSAVLDQTEAFRTTFDDDGQTARVRPDMTHDVVVLDHRGLAPDDCAAARSVLLEREAQTPFDLAEGPLVRATLIREADDRAVLVLYAHHLVFDGWSAEAFLRTVIDLYDDRQPEGLAPFSVLAAHVSASPEGMKRAMARLTPAPGAVDWPGLPETAAGPAAATLHRALPHEAVAAADAMAKSYAVSRSTIWLAAYGVLISGLTDADRLIIGLPVAGQVVHDVPAMGCAVGLVPLLLDAPFDQSFKHVAIALQRQISEAMEEGTPSIGALSRALGISAGDGRPPLVQAVFNYRSAFTDMPFGDGTVRAAENPRRHLAQEFFLNLTEAAGSLVADAEYRTGLFDHETVGRWVDALARIPVAVSQSPEAQCGDVAADALMVLGQPAARRIQ